MPDKQDSSEHIQKAVNPLALARWMDERGLPGAGSPVKASFISGGASNEIFLLERGGERLVMRRPPLEVPSGRNETMLREYRVLSALRDTDVPHSRVLAACEDTKLVGACFYLMEHVDGWSCMNLDGWPDPFDEDLITRRGPAWELVDAIARLSRVDWEANGLQGFGRPDGFHERQVARWTAHLDSFKFRELPGLDEAARWLSGHGPLAYRPGIMHGDYQFANVMFRHGAPARMAAIVDWEMATVGDPLLDLAWVVMGWPDEGEDRSASGYVDYTGMPNRDELCERYSRVSGRSTDDIDYYVVLARFKMACVLEGGYARYRKGGADNPKMAMFGDVVLDMARRAGELARSTDYDG